MRHKALAGLAMLAAAALPPLSAPAQSIDAQSINAGGRPATAAIPFAAEAVARFATPWALAFLPDGRMLVTEKGGAIFLATPDGAKTALAGVPAVAASGQNGLLDIAVSPDFAADRRIYFTYVEPAAGGGRLVLARAVLSADERALDNVVALWRQAPAGGGGQPGGIIAFDPDGAHLFLAVGDRMQPETAQDPAMARGQLVRLPRDGGAAEVWTIGHRNPYGLAFAPDGRLWLHEMGPRGGDELNLIARGRNYGWPLVSNGDNYDGTPIPRHDTRPDLAAPALYWTPVIAPAGLAFYDGAMFPAWRGSALIGGLRAQALVRVAFDASGRPDEAERWDMGARIRDVAIGPDGAIWVIEDANPGRLLRLTPAGQGAAPLG